jgi:hypothetical protein
LVFASLLGKSYYFTVNNQSANHFCKLPGSLNQGFHDARQPFEIRGCNQPKGIGIAHSGSRSQDSPYPFRISLALAVSV